MIAEKTDDRPEFFGLVKDEATDTLAAKLEEKKTKKGKQQKAKAYFQLIKKYGRVFELKDLQRIRDERTTALLTSLTHLRGGAKQAAFGTDTAPKAMILAGLTCGNQIFSGMFEDYPLQDSSVRGKSVMLNVGALKETISDFADRITTPVFIGIRTGYLQNEHEVKQLNNTVVDGVQIIVTTPIQAAKMISAMLPSAHTKKETPTVAA